MAQSSKVTAFQLDPSIAVAPDGATLPGFPGVWRPGVAYHPEALNTTASELQALIDELSLPLVAVKVSEREARKSFELPASHMPSEPSVPHPLAAGPGFGEPESVDVVDEAGMEHRAAVLAKVDEGLAPTDADRAVVDEEAPA